VNNVPIAVLLEAVDVDAGAVIVDVSVDAAVDEPVRMVALTVTVVYAVTEDVEPVVTVVLTYAPSVLTYKALAVGMKNCRYSIPQ